MGAEISDALRRGAKRCVGPGQREGNNAFIQQEEQDSYCTYDVTFRRVRVTTVAVEKKYVIHTLSVFL